jgi:membrane protein implicated in regulation of membrane protease activity
VQRLRDNFGRFVRVYFAFFLGISALVFVTFAIGVAPSGGLGGVAEAVGFVVLALALAYGAYRLVKPLRRRPEDDPPESYSQRK